MNEKVLGIFCRRLGYSGTEIEKFHEGGHRARHVCRLAEAAAQYSIQAEVVWSRHCNSGHVEGQTFILAARSRAPPRAQAEARRVMVEA